MSPRHRPNPMYLRAVVASALAVGLILMLVTAAPDARPAFAAAPSKKCAPATKVDAELAYQYLYAEGSAVALQFGRDQAVERLLTTNKDHLFDAFVALHAPGHDPVDLAGPFIGLGTHTLGSMAATGAVTVNVRATPDRSLKMTVPLVCDLAASYRSWEVPLDDFCRALRVGHVDQQCSKALSRKAKKGLPRSLAKVPIRKPSVVTTPTTLPPPTTTTLPPAPPTTQIPTDGVCPYIGRACDDPNIKVPDPDCTCQPSR